MKINLIVLRSTDIERLKVFYEKLGFSFIKEKHGNGPEHYASGKYGYILELYPAKENDKIGLGFKVDNLLECREALLEYSPGIISDRFVVRDPDGRRVEIIN